MRGTLLPGPYNKYPYDGLGVYVRVTSLPTLREAVDVGTVGDLMNKYDFGASRSLSMSAF